VFAFMRKDIPMHHTGDSVRVLRRLSDLPDLVRSHER
jgi:hypothetical protein